MGSKCSYSQNREDILLSRALPHSSGYYIDVGAADPTEDSVTKYFYDLGWRGINVEPQEEFYQKLCTQRPRDINLKLAVSDRQGELVLHTADSHPGWSTTIESVADEMTNMGLKISADKIPAKTLATLCEENGVTEIDFLKIDVEGAERNVLLGADFVRFRPRIVLLEATAQGTPIPNHDLWEDVILAAGYLFATFDGLNRYYVRPEDAALIPVLSVPVNVFDDWYSYHYEVVIQQNNERIQQLVGMTIGLRQAADELRREADRIQRESANHLYDMAVKHRKVESMRNKLADLGRAMKMAGV